jgi:predicted nucleic acid-binding protein
LLRDLVESGDLIVGDIILCEILQGLDSEAEATRVAERLALLPVVGTVGHALAAEAARNYRLLRRKGITIRRTMDVLIGTFCIAHGHRLLHNDRDFRPMVEHLGLLEA